MSPTRAAAAALDALGDPARRAIVDLPGDGDRSGDRLPVSRPAVSRHLRVLKEKGLRGRFANDVPPVLEALGLAEVKHAARNNRMRAAG